MRAKRSASIGKLSVSFAALITAAAMTPAFAQQVAIDNNDIGGVVTGASGPEAGVWVIAETRDLPTRYIKIVTTDDRGRYVIPDLPRANLRRVGPRLWAGGFAEAEIRPWQEHRSESRAGSEPRCRRGILSRAILVSRW